MPETTTPPAPSLRAADAAAVLLAAHPALTAVSVDTVDVPGLGQTALIQTEDRTALRAWAHALDTTARITGHSSYGTTEPRLPGSPDWLWWRLLYVDTTVGYVPVRLWTLETSAHPRVLATHLAATIPTRRKDPRD
ncbi:hypothetical protein ACIRU8_45570 [Streptomyces sp. NPDC101175]|uniref:hypothetical protein n=1 Tax=Streptomyces sp. NPDC101175 TaxID=3366123 RepID=UPI0038353F9F